MPRTKSSKTVFKRTITVHTLASTKTVSRSLTEIGPTAIFFDFNNIELFSIIMIVESRVKIEKRLIVFSMSAKQNRFHSIDRFDIPFCTFVVGF